MAAPRIATALAVVAALVAIDAPAAELATELSGQVKLVSARSGWPARGVDVDQAVVAFLPESATANPAAPETAFEMATVRKAFAPEVLVVPVGSTVLFPNFDPILHNVFSVTPGNAFDLGIYGRGEGKKAVLTKAGVVRVFCNVHQEMYAHILAVETPHFQRVEADGSFNMRDLPPGPGLLMTWHPQGKLISQRIAGPRRGLSVEIKTDRRRVPRHLNKFGKPYRSRRSRYGGG